MFSDRLDSLDKAVNGDMSLGEIKELLVKKDVIYSREYATTPDMNCPTCNKVILADYPRFCSNCGTRLHYRNNEEDE